MTTWDGKPAMTADEWKDAASVGAHGWMSGEMEVWADGNPHKIAALCLKDQPYGFNHDDVALIRWCADPVALPDNEIGRFTADLIKGENRQRLRDLAARIEALLPPEEE